MFNYQSYLPIDGLVQERRNSSALAMELHISCTNPYKYAFLFTLVKGYVQLSILFVNILHLIPYSQILHGKMFQIFLPFHE